MRSAMLGRSTSRVEVTNVSPHGFWLLIEEQELFVSFKAFPWFEDASIRAIGHVELPSPHHLYWPELDIDLAVDSLRHPERYPLVSTVPPSKRLQPKAQRPTAKKRNSRARFRG